MLRKLQTYSLSRYVYCKVGVRWKQRNFLFIKVRFSLLKIICFWVLSWLKYIWLFPEVYREWKFRSETLYLKVLHASDWSVVNITGKWIKYFKTSYHSGSQILINLACFEKFFFMSNIWFEKLSKDITILKFNLVYVSLGNSLEWSQQFDLAQKRKKTAIYPFYIRVVRYKIASFLKLVFVQ